MMTYDEMIEVIKAAKDGKLIQFRRHYQKNGEWSDVLLPSWDFTNNAYRIKPEPIELWVVVGHGNQIINSFVKKDHAESDAINYKGSRVVHLVEENEE